MTQGSKASSQLIYKRVMLKISGESLMGRLPYGIDPEMVGNRCAAGERRYCHRCRGLPRYWWR